MKFWSLQKIFRADLPFNIECFDENTLQNFDRRNLWIDAKFSIFRLMASFALLKKKYRDPKKEENGKKNVEPNRLP